MSASLLASASTVVQVWDISTNVGSKINGNASSTVIPEQLYGVELSTFSPESSTVVNVVRWNHDSILLKLK